MLAGLGNDRVVLITEIFANVRHTESITHGLSWHPAEGGYSVGHINITAGTIGTCVYDILPGGTISPPAHGVGIPPKHYILSNNHVLANVNAGSPGDLFFSLALSWVGTDEWEIP